MLVCERQLRNVNADTLALLWRIHQGAHRLRSTASSTRFDQNGYGFSSLSTLLGPHPSYNRYLLLVSFPVFHWTPGTVISIILLVNVILMLSIVIVLVIVVITLSMVIVIRSRKRK